MKRLFLGLYVALLLVFFLGPFAWQVLTSMTPEQELTRVGFGTGYTLAAYHRVVSDPAFLSAVLNSFIVAAGTTLICLTVGASAAFALAKLDLPGKKLILGLSLAISMFPPIATVSPLYLALRAVGLRDTRIGLVLPYTTFALPMTLWLLTSYFEKVPDALYKAARVDGCSPFQAFWRVMLPLIAPGLATTAILVFIASWNEFLYALTFVSSPEKRTIPVAISLFASAHREPWADIAGASVLSTLPLVILTLLFQRRIVSGLTAGSVKE